MSNPLLSDWDGPYAIAPFDQISDADFAPALDHAMRQHDAEIQQIIGNPARPDFGNTIEPLEAAGQLLDRVLGAFFTLAGADSTPAREALQREFSPRLAAHFARISTSKPLYERVRQVWETHEQAGLTPEQTRVLMLTHRAMVRAGAALGGAADRRMGAIKERLAVLGTQFIQNLLADERGWSLPLGPDDMDGLPDFVREAALAAGAEQGTGPVITLSRSLIVPFLEFSPRRDLRQIAFQAWAARGANGGETDNRAIATEILELRHERAQLLGYGCFADYKLETEMAKSPEAVETLLAEVWKPALARANADAQILTEMLHADGVNDALAPWDWRYYAQKRRRAEHDLDEQALKPYFQLDRMIDAAFDCANRLFGLEFKPLDVPLYHADCRAWEVTRNGRHVAVFIGDYFARPSKRSGAWCSATRGQAKWPREQTPIVLNVCNFAKATPALLSYDDARTLFHEFGHALHQMLSNVTYESVSGTSVARDFVELPSQLFEHWLEVPEVLAKYAVHAKTGAPIPKALLDRVLKAATFDMGFQTVEYLASAFVDLEFHKGPAPQDIMQRQTQVLSALGMPDAIVMRHATPQFAHVFSGDGYSSGYYSYMWSEVMDADAFEAFEEAGGPFDATLARTLEDHILSTGGSKDAAELYQAFRGRMPGIDALLKGRGLIGAQSVSTLT
jgi:peptidyl-dipeptidase Dcp